MLNSQEKDNKQYLKFGPEMMFWTVIMPVAAVLIFLFLDKKSFWFDEAFAFFAARQSWRDLFGTLINWQANQSLYFTILHFWLKLGSGEFMIRSLSAVFALATVPLIYRLGLYLSGRRVGVIAAFLLISNSSFIHYAQEARSYSLTILLVTLSSFLFVRNMSHPSKRTAITYILTSILAVYAHFFALLVLFTHVLAFVCINYHNPFRKDFVISWAIIFLALFPLGLFVLFKDVGQIDWVANVWAKWPPWMHLTSLFVFLSGIMQVPSYILILSCFIVCLYALFYHLRAWHRGRVNAETRHFIFLLSWLFVPIIITFGVSFLKPVFIDRYLLICLPPFILIMSMGISYIRPRWLLTTVLVILLALSCGQLVYWYKDYKKDNWREAANIVLQEAQPGDSIVFYKWYVWYPFCYYFEKSNASEELLTPYYVDDKSLEICAYPSICSKSDVKRPLPRGEGSFFPPWKHKRVWLILSHVGQKQYRPVQAFLKENFGAISENKLNGVTVILYKNSTASRL